MNFSKKKTAKGQGNALLTLEKKHKATIELDDMDVEVVARALKPSELDQYQTEYEACIKYDINADAVMDKLNKAKESDNGVEAEIKFKFMGADTAGIRAAKIKWFDETVISIDPGVQCEDPKGNRVIVTCADDAPADLLAYYEMQSWTEMINGQIKELYMTAIYGDKVRRIKGNVIKKN